MEEEAQGEPPSSLGLYGQTIGDMNKSHYTDPHKFRSAYPMEIGLPSPTCMGPFYHFYSYLQQFGRNSQVSWAAPLALLPALAFHNFAQLEQRTSARSKPNFAQTRCFAARGASSNRKLYLRSLPVCTVSLGHAGPMLFYYFGPYAPSFSKYCTKEKQVRVAR